MWDYQREDKASVCVFVCVVCVLCVLCVCCVCVCVCVCACVRVFGSYSLLYISRGNVMHAMLYGWAVSIFYSPQITKSLS